MSVQSILSYQSIKSTISSTISSTCLIASQLIRSLSLIGVQPVPTIDHISINKKHRTIMVIGATGTGKTTLLNSMMNYLWQVEYDDAYRFKLVYEQLKTHGQAQSVTDNVTAYHLDPPAVDYELTVIDTPGFGDTRGLEQDQKITKQIKKFFEEKIQEIDAICFAVRAPQARLTATQKYIFAQVLGIFGNDITDNILILMTFADGKKPPVLQALKTANVPFKSSFKLNNSAFDLPGDDDDDDDDDDHKYDNEDDMFTKMFWQMGMASFDKLFKSIDKLETKSLKLTKNVLNKRIILENNIELIQPYINDGYGILEQLRKFIVEINKYGDIINANKDFTYNINVNKARHIATNSNTTICLQCNFTCHRACPYSNNADKSRCSAMDNNGYCRNCPSKCHWSMHKNKPYIVEWYSQSSIRTVDEMKNKYDNALKKKRSTQQLIKPLVTDLMKIEQKLDIIIQNIYVCMNELTVIALKPNIMFENDYIDTLIQSEEREKQIGWSGRINSMKQLKYKQNILNELVNNTYNPWNKYNDVGCFLVANHDAIMEKRNKTNIKWISFAL